MTGQLLAGESPQVASRYQIVLMCLITASTGIATLSCVLITFFVLFDRQVPEHAMLRGARAGGGA